MTVLHVDPERGWGGGEAQVLHLLHESVRRGVACRLAACPDGPLARAAAEAGVPVVPLVVRSHADVAAGFRLRRVASGADVVHFHTARAHALAPWVGRRAWRVVTRRMDYVPRGGAYVRWLYNRAVDVVIAISEGVRAALVAGGVDPARIRVVPSGVDPAACRAPAAAGAALRAAWAVEPTDVLVLVVGALERRKGHRVLLDAAARLSDPRVRVVFCGSGTEEAGLRALAAPLGLRVVFAGFRRDVAACLAAADVVALPSLKEGLGVAALEGMAAGRPVVASRVGGLAEVVRDGDTGVLVPPGDAAALAHAIARLAGDRGLRERLGGAGRAHVEAHYTVSRMAEGTLACYVTRR